MLFAVAATHDQGKRRTREQMASAIPALGSLKLYDWPLGNAYNRSTRVAELYDRSSGIHPTLLPLLFDATVVTLAALIAAMKWYRATVKKWIHNVYPCDRLKRVKDAGIRIRVEKTLRSAFAAACQADNKQASDVLREFMEVYVARYQGGQGDLFSERRQEEVQSIASPRAQQT